MSTFADRNHQILIVDDEEGLRDLHQDNLEEAEFICFTASNGFEALEVLAVEAIDLAVIDVMMPRMSGLEYDHAPWSTTPGASIWRRNSMKLQIMPPQRTESISRLHQPHGWLA